MFSLGISLFECADVGLAENADVGLTPELEGLLAHMCEEDNTLRTPYALKL